MQFRFLIDLIESSGAVSWTPPKGRARDLAEGRAAVVWVDVGRFDASWARDDLYVAPGGEGGMARRYAGFGQWLAAGEAPVEMPEVGLSYRDEIVFNNGRHRYSWLRDHGATAIPVVTETENAQAIQERFGTTQNLTKFHNSRI
jgi:hypothetical protein